MKHNLNTALAILLFLSLPLACSKKHEDGSSQDKTDNNAQVTEIPLLQKEIPPQKQEIKEESQAIEPEIAPAEIHPVSLESIQSLKPEEAENAVLKAFEPRKDAKVIAENLDVLKERAAIGDDKAKEAFVKHVFKLPHTNPEYKTAIRFLTTIREFSDPDVMYQRGIYELSQSYMNPDAEENAKKYFLQAASLNHEQTLDFLLKNVLLGQRDLALEKLKAIYEPRVESGDAKAMYEWARMLEFAPPSEMSKSAELLKKSSDAGYAQAQFTRGISILENHWDEGFALIKKAADNGSKEAWLLLANLYAVGAYTETVEEANQMGIVTFNQETFGSLKAEVSASADPKMLLLETARNASGFDEACSFMEAIGANQDTAETTLKARDYAIECRKQFIASMPTRDACDHAYDQVTYANEPDFDFEHQYTLEQREKLGDIILKCYLQALDNGDDYPRDTPFIDFSTALQTAILYSGESRLPIPADPAKELAYLMYGASHNDIFSQIFLAQDYAAGKYVAQNPLRSCFWFQRAAASYICTNFCKEADNKEATICKACDDANKAVDECRKAAGLKK